MIEADLISTRPRIPLRNDQYVDGCMVGNSEPHAAHHTVLNMRRPRAAFADDYELRSVPRDLRKHRRHGLTAHGMPLHPRRALCCAEHFLGSRCRLFMRLPHSSVDHGFGYTAQSHALNVGKVIGVHHVAVSPLNETTAPENGAPGKRAGSVYRNQRCGVYRRSGSSYEQQRLLKTCQEFECRAAQAGPDLTGIVFSTRSDDDKMRLVLGHHRSDNVAGLSESGVTPGMYAEFRLEIGQYLAQRLVRALCDVLIAVLGGGSPTRKQVRIRSCVDEKKTGFPLPCQLPRPHHRVVPRGGQISRNEDSRQDRHDSHLPANEVLHGVAKGGVPPRAA